MCQTVLKVSIISLYCFFEIYQFHTKHCFSQGIIHQPFGWVPTTHWIFSTSQESSQFQSLLVHVCPVGRGKTQFLLVQQTKYSFTSDILKNVTLIKLFKELHCLNILHNFYTNFTNTLTTHLVKSKFYKVWPRISESWRQNGTQSLKSIFQIKQIFYESALIQNT